MGPEGRDSDWRCDLGSGFYVSRSGRRRGEKALMVGCRIQCTSQNIGMLIFGRIVAGICVGITSSTVPVYQAEMAQKELRLVSNSRVISAC